MFPPCIVFSSTFQSGSQLISVSFGMAATTLPHSFCLDNTCLLIPCSGIRSIAVKLIAQSLPLLLLQFRCFMGSDLGKKLENSSARHCGERKVLTSQLQCCNLFILSDIGMVARVRQLSFITA